MKVVSSSRLIGNIEIEKRKRNGDITQTLAFDNIFILSGYKALAATLARTSGRVDPKPMFSLHLGTGTTEPKITDTGLENRSTSLGPKALENTEDSIAPLRELHGQEVGDGKIICSAFRFTYNYGEGQAEGVWTELGLGDNDYITPLTRALIRDDDGNPMSLTVLSDEFLTIRYTFKIAVDKFYDLGQINIMGSLHNAKYAYNWRSEELRVGSYTYTYVFWGFGFYYPIDYVTVSDAHPNLNEATGETGLYAGTNHKLFTSLRKEVDADGLGVTFETMMDPTDTDLTVKTVQYAFETWSRVHAYLIFEPAVVKPADYRMTLSLHIRMGPEGAPVRGVTPTATSNSLAFTWNAYPDVTEYRLVLRQAGEVVDEQTVTTESATFSGLAAATEYELDIKPLTTTYNGQASLHTATTEAA